MDQADFRRMWDTYGGCQASADLGEILTKARRLDATAKVDQPPSQTLKRILGLPPAT